MTAHLMPHRRVNHTSALFRRRFNAPFIASKPSRVASNKLPPIGPTSRAGEALGVVQAATGGRQQFELECVLAVEQARH